MTPDTTEAAKQGPRFQMAEMTPGAKGWRTRPMVDAPETARALVERLEQLERAMRAFCYTRAEGVSQTWWNPTLQEIWNWADHAKELAAALSAASVPAQGWEPIETHRNDNDEPPRAVKAARAPILAPDSSEALRALREDLVCGSWAERQRPFAADQPTCDLIANELAALLPPGGTR